MFTENYIKAFSHYIELEGGYVDHQHDRGGKTNYGITEKLAREYGYEGSMKDLYLETAQYIIKTAFWDKFKGDKLDFEIAEKLLNMSTNQGIYYGCKSFQRALNLFQGVNIKVDGIVGFRTLEAYRKVKDKQDGLLALLKYLNILQGIRYVDIIERDDTQKSFTRGWTKRLR